MTNIVQTQNYPFCNVTIATPLSNVTGDGTLYTTILDTVGSGSGYNTSTGVFTAPNALYYMFSYCFEMTGLTSSHTLSVLKLVSTFGTFQLNYSNIQAGRNSSNVWIISGSCTTKMAINDTATLTLQISNGTKVVGIGANSFLNIEGFL